MSEENQTATAPPGEGGAAPAVTELQILNGGIEIEVEKIDASSEKVKVRQLPISILGEWGRNQASESEAYLVELLCGKIDRTTVYHLQNARMVEMRVLQILQQAPFEQIEPVEKRLVQIREEIARHEAKERWSDTLTHESVTKIRELGERLNKKKYANQIDRSTKAATAILATLPPSPSSSSSSSSQPSGESQSAT